MTRTDTLKKIDTVVKVCTTCKIKQNSSWKSVEYNRLQSQPREWNINKQRQNNGY